MLTDRNAFESDEVRELDAREKAEAHRFAEAGGMATKGA